MHHEVTPKVRGRCGKGVAQVLSQTVRAPADFAIDATPFKSVFAIVRFEAAARLWLSRPMAQNDLDHPVHCVGGS